MKNICKKHDDTKQHYYDPESSDNVLKCLGDDCDNVIEGKTNCKKHLFEEIKDGSGCHQCRYCWWTIPATPNVHSGDESWTWGGWGDDDY